MGGCLGSVSKTKLTSSVHEHLKEKKHLDHLVHKAKLSADFWSTSTGDMDNYSAAQSQGSISSISTSTRAPDAHGAANTNNHSEFVNHGAPLYLFRWVGSLISHGSYLSIVIILLEVFPTMPLVFYGRLQHK